MTNTESNIDPFVSETLHRLATLEERTKPKKRTFLENLQAYGGLIALLIAIGYSWPIGVWDRFIVDAQKENEKKISEIRASLTRAAELSVEAGKIQSAISNPELRDLATRSVMNQMLLIITKNDAEYSNYRDQLFPEELLMIGLMYQNMYLIEKSLKYFQYAVSHPNISQLAALESNRQIAKTYFFPSPIQDIATAREKFTKILEETKESTRIDVIANSITVQSEWGFFEMIAGDWKCGTDNFDEAIDRLAKWQPMINDQGNMMRLLQSKKSSLSKRAGQASVGC